MEPWCGQGVRAYLQRSMIELVSSMMLIADLRRGPEEVPHRRLIENRQYPLIERRKPNPKIRRRGRPMVRAMRTASCLNSSVYRCHILSPLKRASPSEDRNETGTDPTNLRQGPESSSRM